MNFTMPDDLRYAQTGMVFSSRMVTDASQFEITDSRFDQNIQEFMNQCVFYDILLNKYSIDDLKTAPNIWSFVTSNASPARAFLYNGVVTTCKEGAGKLSSDWANAINDASAHYAARIFPQIKNPQVQQQQLFKYLKLSYGYLTQLSLEADKLMQQNLMANAIQRGIYKMGATLNAPAALESYAFTRAQEQKRLTNQTLGDMAAYWLPLMKNAFEAIMYGSFIFVVLLSVFPFGGMILKNYVFTLLWVQLWAPLYAVINLMISFYAQVQCSSAVGTALSLNSMSGLSQINSDIAGLAGYLTLSVPFLSAGLVKGMAGTFTQIAQYIGGVTQSAGGTAATEAVTGNMGFGNTNFGNHNAYNTSANHFDTSGRFSGGMFSGQLAGGSSVTMMPDGSIVMNTQNALSNLGTSVNLADSFRSAATKQGDAAFTHAQNDNQTFGESATSNMRNVYELSNHGSHSKGNSEGWNFSMNASTATALNDVRSLTEKFASAHNISFSDAQRYLSASYWEAHGGADASISMGVPGGNGPGARGGVGTSIGGKREHDDSYAHDKSDLYSAAKDYIKSTNYSQSVDTVQRAVHDHSLRSSTEQGQRVIENIGASYDKAESARHDMQQSYQEAKSYREIASLAQENAVSINSNFGQVFKEWFANQPGTNGQGRLGEAGVETLIKYHPEIARSYAERFSEQYTSNLMKHSHGLPSSASIKAEYQASLHQHQNESKVSGGYQSNFKHIQHKANSADIDPNMKIDESEKGHTEGFISSQQNNVNQKSTSLDAYGKVTRDSVHRADSIKES
jgi:conjugal transfer mating pair stabilization protein TraG